MADLAERIKKMFSESVTGVSSALDEQSIVLRKEAVLEVMRKLRDDGGLLFNFMMDLTAVDYLGRRAPESRFEVVYHLYSLKHNHRIRVKVPVSENDPTIDSVIPIWKAADWYEREVWDMYGIAFKGHPNLKRILLYEEFIGHPLRKDYPLRKRQPLLGPEN
jgi:NADH-quinone oxidoreductase subunit C